MVKNLSNVRKDRAPIPLAPSKRDGTFDVELYVHVHLHYCTQIVERSQLQPPVVLCEKELCTAASAANSDVEPLISFELPVFVQTIVVRLKHRF